MTKNNVMAGRDFLKPYGHPFEGYQSGYEAGWRAGYAEAAKKTDYGKGYKQGVQDTNKFGMVMMLNAAVLALHRGFHFGKDRLQKFVDIYDGLIVNYVDLSGITEDVKKECDVYIPYDRDGLGMGE